MFTCQLCNGVSKPRQQPKRVVVEWRFKNYLNPGGLMSKGWEIVRELTVCAACALSLNKEKEVTEAYGRR